MSKPDKEVKASGKISRDVAERDFDRFADEWEIDVDKEHMDDEDRQGFENLRAAFIRHVVNGRLVVSEGAETVVQTARNGDQITYQIPDGAAFITMDHHKDGKNMTKMHSYIAAMSGKPLKYFSQMDGRDVKVAHMVAGLFMA